MAGKFELKKAQNDQFYFNLIAGNGEIILTSEMYESKPAALNGIESVKTNASNDSFYERRVNNPNELYFILKAANEREIGKSEYYLSEAALDNGIESVKSNAPNAEVDEIVSA